jgi:hypothetical protein
MRALLLALVIAAGCKGKVAEPEKATGSGSGSGSGSVAAAKPAAVDPWVGVDAAPETPETRKKRADAAIERVAGIQPKLAAIRHLSLDHAIPAVYQTKDDFRAFVHREVTKDAANDKGTTPALVQLGLLPPKIDLAAAEEQAFATQAAAYYDPAQKKFFLVMVPDAPAMLDTVSAHELTHGLQDQHFDLKTFMGEGKTKLDEDAATARRFLVEGDATFTMLLFAAADTGKELTPARIKGMRFQIDMMAGMDTNAMIETVGAQTGLGSGDFADSMKAMRDIPRAVLVPMMDSYTKGALVSQVAFEHGGWAGIDGLYKDPPESTEQVLHPDTKLFPNRDHPKKVTLPKLPGYTEVTSNVLGELMWQVYFASWKHDGDDHVSEDWGGDRYAVVKGKDGKLVGLIVTVWDTPEAAARFAKAYSSTIPARTAAEGHSGKIWVKSDGARVVIVDGGEDAALVDTLAAGAKIDR